MKVSSNEIAAGLAAVLEERQQHQQALAEIGRLSFEGIWMLDKEAPNYPELLDKAYEKLKAINQLANNPRGYL